ncbi:uncharacterized protein UMAG_11345 [Mycosarcoma maydis]|uniref:Methyltransferase type 12 domain-containing protein n=1 Tax=Mycosarcoma maydis TaxID=5270 RepID=A0A0D1E7R8_MYCMD|nr:uncharacterized protein UMAG_11345 [Ustilago maydis 521]KIS71919.1 hypothetical protein UMAG_11345 [Ustilago maydis 521]|eukprot:XP_011386738.1 hypothetical protein UMAG_11345 [Ustilago maydis 521]
MSNSKTDQLITDANKAFYALTAAEYDKLGRGMVVEVAKTNATNILARVPGINTSKTELMDFAAGTGLLAMFLAPRCKTVTAVDQSEAMIQQLRNKLDAQSDGENKIDNIVPVVTDILDRSSPSGSLTGKLFDVITCTNSYHHLSDPKSVTQVLASYLKPGGYLAVVDLIKTDKSAEFHNAPKTIEQQDGSHKQIDEFGAQPSNVHEGENQSHGSESHHGQHHHHHHHHDSSGHKTHKHEHVIAHRGGFSDAEMEDFFSAADLKLVNMGKSAQFVKDGKAYDNFLAIAQKPL